MFTGKRHKGGQRKRYKDVLKSTLKACNIPVDEWQALAQDRLAWRAAIRKGTKHFERSRLQSLDDKRSARKNLSAKPPSTAVPCQLMRPRSALYHFRGSKLICANTSTDASSSYSKDYYYYYYYRYPHKHPRKIKMAKCSHQVDSPFHLWLYVYYGDLQAKKRVWSSVTLNVFTETRCH